MQVFPDKLEDRNFNHDTERSVCSYRNEVERRNRYFHLLESSSFFNECKSTVEVIRKCLDNEPLKRPTADTLIKISRTMEVGN